MNILQKLYEPKLRKERTEFRIKVSTLCGWATSKTFYDKMSGKTALTAQEIEAIKKLK